MLPENSISTTLHKRPPNSLSNLSPGLPTDVMYNAQNDPLFGGEGSELLMMRLPPFQVPRGHLALFMAPFQLIPQTSPNDPS
ncbi:hypothetical protein BDZ45DRAFT_400647 [Acephala macrosclerotiorum]|nr:hypothetical protein BDZ45DRAFT_400647 [Acephala macrosclerotiorum]